MSYMYLADGCPTSTCVTSIPTHCTQVIPVFYMFYLKSEHAVVSCSQRHKKTFEDMMRHQHSSS